MSAVYPSGVDAYIGASVPGLVAQLVAGYVYDATHATLADVPPEDLVGGPVAVTVTGVSGGAVDVAPVTFAAVPAGHTVTGLVVYASGTDPTLVAFVDRRADYTPLSFASDGGDVTLTFTHLLKL